MSNPNPPSGGPPLRALAMVLIALAIVFAGLGAMSLSNSDSAAAAASDSAGSTTASATAPAQAAATKSSPIGSAAPTTTAPTTAAPTTTTAAPTITAAGVDKSLPVRVLNNSRVAGLAARTGSRLTANGWNVTSTGNYPSGVIPKTTVYYESSPREQATAQAIANQLGAVAEPRIATLSGSAPGIIVIVTGE